MKGSSVVASALLSVAIIVVGLWALNNTSIGLNIKCRYLNDLGACFLVVLTEPTGPSRNRPEGFEFVPPPTESPAERAIREAAARQAKLDDDVREASTGLASAVDDLAANTQELKTAAEEMTVGLESLERSVLEGMRDAIDVLKGQTRVRPMDEFAMNDVCFALNDVEFARNDVDLALNDVEFDSYPFETASEARAGYVAAVRSAIASLERAIAANPDGERPSIAVESGTRALAESARVAKSAASATGSASDVVARLTREADAAMSEAKQIANKVATC